MAHPDLLGRPPSGIWGRLVRDPLSLAALIVAALLTLGAIFAPVLTPYDPLSQSLPEAMVSPSTAHPLGTDQFGRDVLTRVLFGGRISLAVGIGSQLLALLIGLLLGSLAGYVRGWVDSVVMWLVNVVWAFPFLLLAMAIVVVLGPGINQVFLAIGLASWIGMARIVRGRFFSLREQPFVEAARALGLPGYKIVLRHLLPNAMGPVIVLATLGIGEAILIEAGLSFLGLGAQPPTPSWGQMIYQGYGYILAGRGWWLAVAPGLAIMMAVIAFNLLGDGLRDALEVKMQ